MNPAITHIIQFFDYTHLPAHLQDVSRPYAELAEHTAQRYRDSPETVVALRMLLVAKDAAVRAAIEQMERDRHGK